jgi:hypothetical protein
LTQLFTTTAHGAFSQTRRLRHGLNPTIPQFQRFAGRPKTTSPFVQFRPQAVEFPPQAIDNGTLNHDFIMMTQGNKNGQLFIYASLECSKIGLKALEIHA